MGSRPPTKLAGDSTSLRTTYLAALVEASKILNSTLDLDRLLELILEVATSQLHADRGTVWLVDKSAGELRARVSQGLESKVLRVRIGEGIAGAVGETGTTIRVEDAYRDSRFSSRFDTGSGYRTRTLLTSAIRNNTGEIIGVIELLNKVDGPFDAEDEVFLEALTVQMAIALENAKLHGELIHQQRLRTELALARQIQQNLLKAPPERWHRYRFAAHAEPCYEVGGDFYDFMPLSDTSLWLVIADVSGKGVSAALVMSTLQATLRASIAGVHSFEQILVRLNRTVREFTGGSHYVTMFLALLNSENRSLHYINAGHNPPLLMRADGRAELLDQAGGTVIGLLPEVQYSRAQTELRPGDVLTLYTDGLVEANNPAGDQFGVEGLTACIDRVRSHAEPGHVLEHLRSSVQEFAAGTPAADDRTLVVIVPD